MHWFIDCPFLPSQVNQSDLTLSQDQLYNQIKTILDAMEHYYSLGEINLAIQETDSLLGLLKAADNRIDETFLLHVRLEQLVMNLIFSRVVFQAFSQYKPKKAEMERPFSHRLVTGKWK